MCGPALYAWCRPAVGTGNAVRAGGAAARGAARAGGTAAPVSVPGVLSVEEPQAMTVTTQNASPRALRARSTDRAGSCHCVEGTPDACSRLLDSRRGDRNPLRMRVRQRYSRLHPRCWRGGGRLVVRVVGIELRHELWTGLELGIRQQLRIEWKLWRRQRLGIERRRQLRFERRFSGARRGRPREELGVREGADASGGPK